MPYINPQELIYLRPKGKTALDFVQEAAEEGLKYVETVEIMAQHQWYIHWCYTDSPGEMDDPTARWWCAVEKIAARMANRMISGK